VAAANCPITHIGTGEHMDDLESFDPRGFIQKMLGTAFLLITTFSFSLKSQERSTDVLVPARQGWVIFQR